MEQGSIEHREETNEDAPKKDNDYCQNWSTVEEDDSYYVWGMWTNTPRKDREL